MSTSSARQGFTATHAEEAALKASAARLSVAAAASLIVIKFATGWLTGSISVWASLLDSAMDVIASAINYFAVRAASHPADEDHPYGHGKAESLAGLFQAAVITISGLYLIIEALRRIITPRETRSEMIGVAAMLAAVAVSVLLVWKLRRAAAATDSPALAADAVHYATDIYSNGAALVALLVTSLTNWQLADPLFSIAISIYIIASAYSVAKDSVDVLMDRRLPAEFDERVAEVVSRFRTQGVVGFHDLRTRRSGSVKFLDLHLEVERDKSLEEAHEITVRVIRALQAEVPRSRVQIHTDPV
jgi:ferrous-iron efflux pump FieF